MNVPEGSVTVTAGGVRLIENQDYTVDYNLGQGSNHQRWSPRVGTEHQSVSLESNSLFSIQTKTMMGTRFDYVASDKFNIGATFLNLRERPLTQKVNIGNEPVNNSMVGSGLCLAHRKPAADGYHVDKLPFYETSAKVEH